MRAQRRRNVNNQCECEIRPVHTAYSPIWLAAHQGLRVKTSLCACECTAQCACTVCVQNTMCMHNVCAEHITGEMWPTVKCAPTNYSCLMCQTEGQKKREGLRLWIYDIIILKVLEKAVSGWKEAKKEKQKASNGAKQRFVHWMQNVHLPDDEQRHSNKSNRKFCSLKGKVRLTRWLWIAFNFRWQRVDSNRTKYNVAKCKM